MYIHMCMQCYNYYNYIIIHMYACISYYNYIKLYKCFYIIHKRCNKTIATYVCMYVAIYVRTYVHMKLCILNQPSLHMDFCIENQLGYACLLNASYYICSITLSHTYIRTYVRSYKININIYLDKYDTKF